MGQMEYFQMGIRQFLSGSMAHHNFPEPKAMSSNFFFCPTNNQRTQRPKEKQRTLTKTKRLINFQTLVVLSSNLGSSLTSTQLHKSRCQASVNVGSAVLGSWSDTSNLTLERRGKRRFPKLHFLKKCTSSFRSRG